MKFDLHSIIILIKVPGQESMELKSILENRIGKKSLSFNEDSFTYLNVKQLIQYPTSEEFVFLELDSLKSPVVEKAMSLAVHSFYNVSFVMKNDFANLHLSELKDFKNQINGLKENQKINIRYNVFDSLSKESIEIKDFDLWKKTKHKFQSALIIGDIHEDVVALKALLKNVSKDVKIISVGDYLDKGNQTKEIISLIEQIKNEYDFDIVVGNHESFVARRLRKEIPRLERELDTFSSLKVLYKDDNLATRFLKIYDDSLPFLNFKYLDKKVVVTHAPCKESYLGKMNDFAQKSQRNFYFKNRDKDAMESELEFMAQSAKESNHIHVFGHVAHKMDSVFMLNKVWLDTGSVYGNKLSGLLVNENGFEVISVKGSKLDESELLKFNDQKVQTKFKKYF